MTSNSTDHPRSSNRTAIEDDHEDDLSIRDIHALTPPHPPPPPPTRLRRRDPSAWETGSHRSSLSAGSDGAASSDNFTTMSNEFSALVLAGSALGGAAGDPDGAGNNLGRIGEEEEEEETNPLAIVPDSGRRLEAAAASPRQGRTAAGGGEVTVERVKKEEVETKIRAWETEEVAKVNNRYKREEAVINGWENEQVQKATSWMSKVERKLEEKRARALEKMQNEIARARRKAEERRASAEAKRGTKAAKVLDIANLMKAVGKAPTKRSFF
ncbi:remorin 4.1 [Malania oleifera]|uniref:remorin 4.1 n=1 Tax=Malania oleifera TaxID=397392 RepID=UPI0025ADE93E|nr:remorin 4.1 [Malania oleifera]